ncbi:MAG: hypothetical protein ACREF8_01175, partial [Chthoniobacterales bacterium]
LIELFEKQARQCDLVGSFGLLAAAAVLTIPYERMKASHFLHDEQQEYGLAAQMNKLERVKFLSAPFWEAEGPGEWQQSRIMGSVNQVDDWKDDQARPSLSADANTIKDRKAEPVIRVLRNALAHGNIIYLDKDRREISGNRLVYLAFLSRYEETKEQRELATTYRVVITSVDEFLHFVKAWARWVSTLPLDYRVSEAA